LRFLSIQFQKYVNRIGRLEIKILSVLVLIVIITIMTMDEGHNESKIDKDSRSLTCDVCEQTFDTMESFKEHKLSENRDEGLKYKGID
jgi:hypothetical protein